MKYHKIITIQSLLTASQVIYVELTVHDNKILCLFMSELQSVSNVNILIKYFKGALRINP